MTVDRIVACIALLLSGCAGSTAAQRTGDEPDVPDAQSFLTSHLESMGNASTNVNVYAAGAIVQTIVWKADGRVDRLRVQTASDRDERNGRFAGPRECRYRTPSDLLGTRHVHADCVPRDGQNGSWAHHRFTISRSGSGWHVIGEDLWSCDVPAMCPPNLVWEQMQCSGQPERCRIVPPVTSGLSRAQIAAVFTEAFPLLKRCYERALSRNPALNGNLIAEVTIKATGNVESALTHGTMEDKEMRVCAEGELRKLKFPVAKGGGDVFVRYPFVFGP